MTEVSREEQHAWIKELKVGDTVFFVDRNHGRAPILQSVEVTKVGRTLIHTPQAQFHIETGMQKTQYSPGCIYRDEQTYEQDVIRQKVWAQLNTRISRTFHVPKHLTIEQIKVLEELLYPS